MDPWRFWRTSGGTACMRNSTSDSAGIDEIREPIRSDIETCISGMRIDQMNQFAQYSELEFQFDAVRHPFNCGFDHIEICVFHREQTEIHRDHGDTNTEELIHDLVIPLLRKGP